MVQLLAQKWKTVFFKRKIGNKNKEINNGG